MIKTDKFGALSLTLIIWQTVFCNMSGFNLIYSVVITQSFPTCRSPQEALVPGEKVTEKHISISYTS